MLAAGVAVRALGDAGDGNVAHAEIGKDLAGDGKLSGAAVDQHEIGVIGKCRVVEALSSIRLGVRGQAVSPLASSVSFAGHSLAAVSARLPRVR